MSPRPTKVREVFAKHDHQTAMHCHPPDLEAAADARASLAYEYKLRAKARSTGHIM